MSNYDQLMWRAIEGALGAEKRAFLQRAPLTSVVGGDGSFALPHAISASVSSQRHKHAEAQSIRSGLEALALVAKEASVSPKETFPAKVARAHKLRTLEPHLSGGNKQAAARTRRALNVEIMETVKQAGVGTALSGIIENPALREGAKKMMAGAGLAGGAALPVYLTGSALSDKFTEDSRNRALQTAAGVAGIGTLGYGAKKLMDQAAEDRSRDQNYAKMDQFRRGAKMSHEKIAADVYVALHMPQEKVAHLATAVYLDECLASVEQTSKVAGLRELNGEFLTELLATSVKTAEDDGVPEEIAEGMSEEDRNRMQALKLEMVDGDDDYGRDGEADEKTAEELSEEERKRIAFLKKEMTDESEEEEGEEEEDDEDDEKTAGVLPYWHWAR